MPPKFTETKQPTEILESTNLETLCDFINKSESDDAVAFIHANNENTEYLNSQNSNGDTVLISAARKGLTDVVAALIEYKVIVPLQNNNFRDAFMYAAAKGNKEMAQILLDAGADINSIDSNGLTPLIMAARNGHLKMASSIIKELHRTNGHLNVETSASTALLIQANRMHRDIEQMLSQATEKPDTALNLNNPKIRSLYLLLKPKLMTEKELKAKEELEEIWKWNPATNSRNGLVKASFIANSTKPNPPVTASNNKITFKRSGQELQASPAESTTIHYSQVKKRAKPAEDKTITIHIPPEPENESEENPFKRHNAATLTSLLQGTKRSWVNTTNTPSDNQDARTR